MYYLEYVLSIVHLNKVIINMCLQCHIFTIKSGILIINLLNILLQQTVNCVLFINKHIVMLIKVYLIYIYIYI